MQIPVDSIRPNPLQARHKNPDVRDLVESIGKIGLIQPIIISKKGKGYVIVAGERRWLATKKLGLETIDAKIVDLNDPKLNIAHIMAENEAREPLTGKERAVGYQTMVNLGWEDEEIGQVSGVTDAEISSAMKVAKAPKTMMKKMPDQATLGELEGLLEFEGTPVYESLESLVGTDQFVHRLSLLRQQKEQRLRIEAAIKLLERSHVRYIPYEKVSHRLLRIPNPRFEMTVQEHHKTCPGHCATVMYTGVIQYLCDNPERHGLPPGEKTPLEKKADKDLDKRKRQMRVFWRASAPIRREFVTGLLRTKPSTLLLNWAYSWATVIGCPAFGAHNCKASSYTTSKSTVTQFVAICVAMAESGIDDWVKYQGAIGRLGYEGLLQSYLEILIAEKYPAADYEIAASKGTEYKIPPEPKKKVK